jgi:hypothetical protein
MLNSMMKLSNAFKGGKSPIIKEYAKRGKFTAYIIDGEKARMQDESITNWATAANSKIVPENEIWIDKEAHPDEYPTMLEEALVYQRARESGKPNSQAMKLADRKAADEFGSAQKTANKRKPYDPNVKVEERKLGVAPDGSNIFLVNGDKVRKLIDPDFTEGGHDLVYKFIPKHTYWIDNQVAPAERGYMLAHEMAESPLMAKGKSYEQAHKIASEKEHLMRVEGGE